MNKGILKWGKVSTCSEWSHSVTDISEGWEVNAFTQNRTVKFKIVKKRKSFYVRQCQDYSIKFNSHSGTEIKDYFLSIIKAIYYHT